MADTNYQRPSLTITNMVFNRMRFLDAESATNIAIIGDFVWEIMNVLERCFRVSVLSDDSIDLTRIGKEEYYSVEMQSIIADIVCTYVLMYQVGLNAQGTSTTPATTRFLKRAKAGTAEVEWGQFSTKDGVGFFTNADALIDMYKRSAANKARNLGCILDICDDCTASLDGVSSIMPVLTVSDCGCS